MSELKRHCGRPVPAARDLPSSVSERRSRESRELIGAAVHVESCSGSDGSQTDGHHHRPAQGYGLP